MAYTTTPGTGQGGILGFASRFWDTLVHARASSLDTVGRVAEMERLNALSDDELAARGLRREDIARHVFRDLYYI